MTTSLVRVRSNLNQNLNQMFLKIDKMVEFFASVLLKGNKMVSRSLWINLHSFVFQRVKLHSPYGLMQLWTLWKTNSCKLIPNWTRNHLITYTNDNNIDNQLVVAISNGLTWNCGRMHFYTIMLWHWLILYEEYLIQAFCICFFI